MFGLSLFDNPDKYCDISDEELADKIRCGKKHLYEIVFDRYKDKIYSYVRHLLNYNNEDAMQVSSDVFVKMYNYICRKEIGSIKAVLYRIARNEALNYINLNKSENKNCFEDEYVKNLEDRYPEEHRDSLNMEYKNVLLNELLGNLDERFREVLHLYYFERKDYNEIADIMDSNKNTVGTLIFRAKKQLKEVGEKHGYTEIFID